MRRPVLYTVGHSTRPIDEFVALLRAHGIEKVVDVRTLPRSRFNPQYDQAALRRSLKAAHIRYQHLPRLGGLRHAQKESLNTGWINASFRGFADYMQSKDFQRGVRDLQAGARVRRTAIMCAEAFVGRCHRSLIADALSVAGWRGLHIQSRRTAAAHRRTPFLRVRRGRLLYPEPARLVAARVRSTARGRHVSRRAKGRQAEEEDDL
jgi:uncharacterized protein (DUF488 family)